MDFESLSCEKTDVPAPFCGLRILLVDNDTTSLLNLASALEEHSFKVTTIEKATVALSILRERIDQFDLVMVDVNMPDMECFEFINCTQLIKDIPIILMSSNVKREMVEQAVAQGVCFFFMKPISAKKLKNIWQHVYRHQKKVSQKLEKNKANNQVEVMDNTSFANKKMQDTKGKIIVNSAEGSKGKRKRITDEETQVKNGDSEKEDRSLVSEKTMEKRRRLHWTPDLEKKFKKAVRKLGQKGMFIKT
ncbi:two-component response regulator ORR26-like [Nicotiana tomentosiformis]|uniref:two-component response regulator ORR26-like n=1 Tax=Nicotiana tomentosiformis TaxID=4098 RepID=UPI00388CC794